MIHLHSPEFLLLGLPLGYAFARWGGFRRGARLWCWFWCRLLLGLGRDRGEEADDQPDQVLSVFRCRWDGDSDLVAVSESFDYSDASRPDEFVSRSRSVSQQTYDVIAGQSRVIRQNSVSSQTRDWRGRVIAEQVNTGLLTNTYSNGTAWITATDNPGGCLKPWRPARRLKS